MVTLYDKRTGQALKEGTSVDYSTIKDPSMLKYDEKTGAPLSNPMNVITSDAFNGNSKPYTLPNDIPPTTASGLEASIGVLNGSVKTESDRLRDERIKANEARGKDVSSSLDAILATNKEIGNVGNTVDRTAEDTARKEADRLTSEIEAEQLSNRRRIENLRKNNPEGLFGGGLEQEVRRIDAESVSKQADLAILQNSALRNYSTANSIANRQVELKLEPLKTNLENLKFFYEANKTDFNREDDRLYSEAVKKADNEYKKQETLYNDIKNVKLEAAKNGADYATLEKISKSKNLTEALQAAGKFSSDPIDRAIKNAQLKKLNREISLLGEPTEKEKKDSAAALKEAKASIPVMQDKIDAVDVLSKHSGLNTRVGASIQTRKPASFLGGVGKAATIVGIPGLIVGGIEEMSGSGQDFAGGVHKLVGGLTLDNLIAAKARGATFGALSEGELSILASSATAINDWEIKDSKGRGKGIWDIDEESFQRELKTIQNLTRRAIYLSEGTLMDSSEDAVLDSVFTPDNMALDPSNYYNK